MTLISIVLPVYNVEPYIERCIRSCLSQEGDFELIFVDDCGSDRSIQIVEQYSKFNKSIRIIKNLENKGTLISRKVGAFIAEGEYIFFLDPDDELPKDSIKYLSELISGSPIAFDVIMTGVSVVSDRFPYKTRFPLPKPALRPDILKSIYLDVRHPFYGTPGKIYSRRIINSAFKFIDSLEKRLFFGEDWVLFFICSSLANATGVLDKDVYVYHKNATSITNSKGCNAIAELVEQTNFIISKINELSSNPELHQADTPKVVEKIIRNLTANIFFMRRHEIGLNSRGNYVKSLRSCYEYSKNRKILLRILIYYVTFSKIRL